jgi:hypothetical protein
VHPTAAKAQRRVPPEPISGARIPHGFGSAQSDVESGDRNQRGLAPR